MSNINKPPDAIQETAGDDGLVARLKQDLDATRLPADVKTQVLAEGPSAEELERSFRELQEQGGLSSEAFLASLGLDVGLKP